MPRLNQDHTSQITPLEQGVESALQNIAVTTDPVVIIGVSRRAALGNYEHIDVYSGVAIPATGFNYEDKAQLRAALEDIADVGFAMTSTITYEKYIAIKEMAKPKPEEPTGVQQA